MLLYFLLFFLINHIYSSDRVFECLDYDEILQKCNFCSYNYYDSLLSEHTSEENFLLKPKNCLPKLQKSCDERKILVLNQESSLSYNEFQIVYHNFSDFLNKESFYNNNYCFNPKITAFLSKGTHLYIEDIYHIATYKSYFRRVNADLSIKPLFCDDFPKLREICVEKYNKPVISIFFGSFAFIISNRLTIENIDFEDTNSYSIEKEIFFSLFQLEAIFDDPQYNSPVLNIKNVNFLNFIHGYGKESLIFVDTFGGRVNISNVSINSFEESISFIIFYENNLKENIYWKNWNNFSKSIEISKHFCELFIDTLNFYSIFNSKSKIIAKEIMNNINSVFYLSALNYNISIKNLMINNITRSNALINNYIFFFGNGIYQNFVYFTNISLENLVGFQALYASKVKIIIENMNIANSKFEKDAFYFENSNFTITNLKTIGSSLNDLYNVFYVFSVKGSSCVIKNSEFMNFIGFSNYFLQSNAQIISSNFQNIDFSQRGFILENTLLISLNNIWTNTINFSNFFQSKMNYHMYFLSNKFIGLFGYSFLGGNFVDTLQIKNSSFENITNMIYFFNKEVRFLNIFLLESSFWNISLAMSFLYAETEITIYYSNCIFKEIKMLSEQSLNFLAVFLGKVLMESLHFENIMFFNGGGSALFRFKQFDVVIKDSVFINCGFAYKINTKKLASTDFINVLWVWGCRDIFLQNNSFHNYGDINLFTGFIHCTLTTNNLTLIGNIFRYSEKILGNYYSGLILSNAPNVILMNNKFQNINCANYASFIHNHGVVTLQGENTYSIKNTKKKCILENNLFFDCYCQKGGSLGIINYDRTIIRGLFFFNSSAIVGGSLFLASSSSVLIENIFINQTKSENTHSIFLFNIIFISMKSIVIIDGYSSSDGGIATKNTNLLQIYGFLGLQLFCDENAGAFILRSGDTKVLDALFFFVHSRKSGGVIYLNDKGNLSLENSIIFNCSSKIGGGIYIDYGNFVQQKNCSFLHTKSYFQGSSQFINIVSKFIIEVIFVIKCESASSGIIFLQSNDEKSSNYVIKNMTCYNNYALKGSCLFAESKGDLSLFDFEIKENSFSPLYFLSLANLKINISNGVISDCIVDFLIVGNNVTINLQNSVFFNNSLEKSIINYDIVNASLSNVSIIYNVIPGPIILLHLTHANISNISINQNLREDSWNVLVFSLRSNLIVSFISLFDLSIKRESILQIEESYFVLENSSFENTKSTIIRASDSFVSMKNCKFLEYHPDLINVFQSFSSIFKVNNNISFINTEISIIENMELGKNYKISLDFINIEFLTFINCKINILANIINPLYVLIHQSMFFNCSSSDYQQGTLSLLSSFKRTIIINIFNSSFISNCAIYSGAIFIEGLFEITVKNSFFFNNRAICPENSRECGIGGVGIFSCSFVNCRIYLLDNEFYENFADYIAPTFFSNSPMIAENNIFTNNSDGNNFSKSISGFPLSFKLLNLNETNSHIEIASGSPITLEFSLLDYFNQVIIFKKKVSSFIINSISSSGTTLFNILSQVSYNGVFTFADLLIITKPNSTILLEIWVLLNDELFFKNVQMQHKIEVFSRPCVRGEIMTSDLQCKICPFNSFSIENPMNFNQKIFCKPCLKHAFCPGGAFLVPEQGFWRISSDSLLIIPCLNQEFCMGPPESIDWENVINNNENSNKSEYFRGQCYPGHTDNLCNSCIKGYGKANNNNFCIECSKFLDISYLKFFVLMFLAAAYAILNTFFYGHRRENHSIVRGIGKICINHLQKISIITYFDNSKNMMLNIKGFFDFLSAVSFLDEDNVSNECFMSLFSNDFENFYLYKVFVIMVFPLVQTVFTFSLLIFIEFLLLIFKKNHGFEIKSKTYLMFFIIIFIFYPLVTKCSLSLINCIHLDKTHVKYLYSRPNIVCWEEAHKKIFFIGSFLGIYLWGLFFPILLIFLNRRAIKLHQLKSQSSMASSANLPSSSMLKTKKMSNTSKRIEKYHHLRSYFHFFHQDYSNEIYYWESILFLYKFLLSLFPNLNSIISDEHIDFIFLLTIFVYLYFLNTLQPFKAEKLNFLESLSNIITVFSRLLVILSNSKGLKEGVRIALSFAFILINILFLAFSVFFIYKFYNWKQVFSTWFSHHPRTSKFLDVFRYNLKRKGKKGKRKQNLRFNLSRRKLSV